MEQEENEKNCKLYMQLFDIEVHADPITVENVIKLLDKAIKTEEMPIRQKILFSQRKIEFLEDFGQSVDQLQKTKDDHEKLVEVMKKEGKLNEDGNNKNSRENEKPKSKNGENTTTYGATNSAAYGAAHASSYNQYGSRYNYSQYYQGYYQPSY